MSFRIYYRLICQHLCSYVSLKRQRGTGSRERGVSKNRHFLQVIGCVRDIDLHFTKPCFSVEFVDTYSTHSFPSPSRRTQQIQPFRQCGVGVCPDI